MIPLSSGFFSEAALAVGTPVTRCPPHRPGRSVFPHPVPRSHSLSRKTFASCKYSMSLLGRRESWFQNPEAIYGLAEGVPSETFPLASPSVQPFERALYRPVVETPQGRRISDHAVIHKSSWHHSHILSMTANNGWQQGAPKFQACNVPPSPQCRII